mgnify:CR=1 FL=1
MRILKRTVVAGAGIAGLAGLTQTAQADTEVVTNHLGQGDGELIKGDKSAQKAVDEVNKAIENLQREFTFVKVEGTGNLTKEQVEAKKAEFRDVQAQLNKMNAVIQNAQAKGVEVNGETVVTSLEELQKIVTAADKIVKKVASPEDTARLQDLVREANTQIANAKRALVTHAKDGIVGNLDDIHRKAEDAKKNGLTVDTTETKKANAVTETTVETIKNKEVNETNISKTRDQILAKIKNVATENSKEIDKAKTYKDNSIKNIESISNWIKSEQNKAKNVLGEVEKNSTAIKDFNDYKASQVAELEKAKKTVTDSTRTADEKAKLIEKIDEAIKNIKESTVTPKATAGTTVQSIGEVDFGNIGRDPKEVEALKAQKSKEIDNVIKDATDKLASANTGVMTKIKTEVASNKSAIKTFIDGVLSGKGSGGSQIDQEWLNTRPIYSGDTSGEYKKYVEAALRQTAESTEGVFTGTQELTPNMSLKYAKEGKTIANIAAAQWMADSKKGLDGAFGSVMVPSKNINDFVTVRGKKAANSQKFKGGAQGILDYIGQRAWVSGTRRHNIYKEAVFADIKNQHINYVGNENVLLVASYQDHITFDFNDSYVTYDANGKPKTYPMSLTMHAIPFHGSKWPNDLPGNSRLMFLYYISVDPKTGKVLTGVGYYRHILQGTGASGDSTSRGELRLGRNEGNAGEYNDTETLANHKYFSPILYANQASNPYTHVGLWTTFDARVDEGAGEGAKRSPLFIGDIDDNQIMYVYKDTYGTNTDIILSGSEAPTIRDGGDYYALDSHVPKSNGLAAGANLDKNSVMITGQSTVGIGHGGWYQSIDVSLFNPWGIIGGAPSLSVKKINEEVDTFNITTPTAKAHTEGAYNVKNIVANLVPKPTGDPASITNVKYEAKLARAVAEEAPDKRVASNTSLVVRKVGDDIRKSGSGNSFVVKTADKAKVSASGNSLVVRVIDKNQRSASGNSFVVRTLEPTAKLSGSGNSLVVTTPDKAVK